MIDTIILTIPHPLFSITKPELFTPHASWMLADSVTRHGILSKQNPTKRELTRGIYKPRLTLMQWQQSPVLKIELSLPKLMFGNNFAELQYKDFSSVADKLIAVLADMGVIVTPGNLESASVSTIHYAKNIKLTDGSTPYHYIQKLKAADIKLSLDVNQTDYRNDGHSYKWHCNTYEVAFYDKIKDLEQAKISSKRALEKDSALQIHLIKKFRTLKKLEFLRMEVRLNKRAKMKQLFKKLDIATDLTFKKLFKPAISKKILTHYLEELESKCPLLLDYKPSSPQGLLADLMFNNPDMTLKKIMQIYGLKQALMNMTPRELKMMCKGKHKRNWYLLLADAAKVQLPSASSPLRDLKKQLYKFEMIRL